MFAARDPLLWTTAASVCIRHEPKNIKIKNFWIFSAHPLRVMSLEITPVHLPFCLITPSICRLISLISRKHRTFVPCSLKPDEGTHKIISCSCPRYFLSYSTTLVELHLPKFHISVKKGLDITLISIQFMFCPVDMFPIKQQKYTPLEQNIVKIHSQTFISLKSIREKMTFRSAPSDQRLLGSLFICSTVSRRCVLIHENSFSIYQRF